MTAPTVLSSFSYLLNEAQDLVFMEARDDQEPVYPKYTKPGDTSEADFRSATVVGFGAAQFTPELGSFAVDAFEAGDERTSTWEKYTIGTYLSEEFYDDMLQSSRVKKDRVKMLKKLASEMAKAHAWRRELNATQFQTSATSTTATSTWRGAGRDGVALASASHATTKNPPVTVSNLQTAASLTQLAVQEAITMLNNQLDESGRPMAPVKKVGLIYGRFHEWRVPEILLTMGVVDSANNNINTLNKKQNSGAPEIVPILNPYLSNTSTMFQVIDLDNHELIFFDRKKPEYQTERDISTGSHIHRSVSRHGVDFLSYKGLVHNAGV